MLKKVLSYGIVGGLALTLLVGTAYILARPSADRVGQKEAALEIASGDAYQGRQGVGRGSGDEVTSPQDFGGVRAQANGADAASADAAHADAAYRDGQWRTNRNVATALDAAEGVSADAWETIQGVVVSVDHEAIVQTAEGEILIGLGQAQYRDDVGFVLQLGDEVIVTGFDEDGEFKAATVENLTTGSSVVLRDEAGRPMWAGRGNLKNQP